MMMMMMRCEVGRRRLASLLLSSSSPPTAASACFRSPPIHRSTSSRSPTLHPLLRSSIRGNNLVPHSGVASGDGLPPTEAAKRNRTPAIFYDERNHERYPPGGGGDPSKKAFAYLALTGGRFVYASLFRLLLLKLVLSMSATSDVLALSTLDVDLAGIEPGKHVTVKWRGKPVFIWHRTEEDIRSANSVDLASLRDPEGDSARAKKAEWLIVVGVCTHLGCIPLPKSGEFGGYFCPCHGSHYDASGRVRKGPAPRNLEVPHYVFLEDGSKLLIGSASGE